MEINISELRKKGRPLWMTDFDLESYSDMLGGGGDIWSDRLYPEWMRDFGSESEQEESK